MNTDFPPTTLPSPPSHGFSPEVLFAEAIEPDAREEPCRDDQVADHDHSEWK